MRIHLSVLLVWSFSACSAITVRAVDRYVAQEGQAPVSPYNSGWESAASNIQEAVDAASANDTVWVGPGRYTAPANATNFYGPINVVYINKPLTLRSSSGVPESVVIDGEGMNRGIAWHLVAVNANRFVLDGLTVSNCVATNIGGGILFVPNVWTATVQNCVITDNRVAWLTTDVTNTVTGGGIYGYATAGWGLTVSNCVFRRNWASNAVVASAGASAGGLYAYGYGTRLITHCLFEDNGATMQGGAAASPGATFAHCTFRGNRTDKYLNAMSGGGAVYNPATFRNCLLYNNWAASIGSGGAIFNDRQGTVYVQNCTIVSNKPSGIHMRQNTWDDYLVMDSSIVYSNATVDVSMGLFTNFVANSCVGATNWAGVLMLDGNITNPPLFVDFAGENFRLSRGSPCINAGASQEWMTGALDLDGNPRIDAGTGVVDMGCYEFLFPGGAMIMLR